MRACNSNAIPVVVYGARAFDDALLELKDVLTEMGFSCCSAVAAVAEHSNLHIYGQGRPDAADNAQLADFSKQIMKQLSTALSSTPVSVPGKHPYIQMGGISLHPQGNPQMCNQCGHCTKVCPMGAIPNENGTETDSSKCITCMRCVQECPTHVRDFQTELINTVREQMRNAFADERHNEFFL